MDSKSLGVPLFFHCVSFEKIYYVSTKVWKLIQNSIMWHFEILSCGRKKSDKIDPTNITPPPTPSPPLECVWKLISNCLFFFYQIRHYYKCSVIIKSKGNLAEVGILYLRFSFSIIFLFDGNCFPFHR